MTSPTDPGIEYGATCYRHSKRGTNVRCQNCGKPICSECMRDTPVGYRCPDCAPQSRPIFDESMLATKAMLGICLVVYVVQVVMELGHGQGARAIMDTTNNELFQRGALFAGGVSENHEWYRIFTAGFLHAGLIHIALNSYFIWILGQLIEAAVGKLRFTLLFITSLIGGSVGALALTAANSPTIGASGAAFGLLGAALVMAKLRRNEDLAQQLLVTAVINFALTLALPGISVGGHLGGFITGAVCGWIAYGPLQRIRWAAPAAFAGLGLILFAVAMLVAHEKTQAFLNAAGVS